MKKELIKSLLISTAIIFILALDRIVLDGNTSRNLLSWLFLWTITFVVTFIVDVIIEFVFKRIFKNYAK